VLRRLVLWLALVNLGYLAWSQGWLAALGPWAAPTAQREPYRLQQQIDPGGITLLPSGSAGAASPPTSAAEGGAPADTVTPDAAASAADNPPAPASVSAASASAASAEAPESAAAPSPASVSLAQPLPNEPRQCVQLGALTERQADALKPVLAQVLPPDAWVLERSVQPARWVVYIGRLPNAETLVSRRAELRQLGVAYRDVSVPGLPPGLALGTYSNEASAQQALRDVTRAGVKGARVAEERTEVTLYMARLPKVTATQRAAASRALAAVAGNPWGGKSLQPCP
jgi:hypothetical protein